jgi:hypothetical protein
MGRASNKEGEPEDIIQKLLSVLTQRNCALRESGFNGHIYFFGEIDNAEAATRRYGG